MYASFREQILEINSTSGLEHLAVPQMSRNETVFTDYFFTSEKKDRCLVHLSGVHGVEGYLGSLIQQKILKQKLRDLPFQVVIVHAVNPIGMAHFQRTNGNNVDLNRNSMEVYQLQNPNFPKFKSYLDSGSSSDFIRLLPVILKIGLQETVKTVSCGQSQSPDSLFFTGHELQPELISLVETLKTMTKSGAQLRILDVHTGLGRKGREMLILDGFDNRKEQEFFESCFFSPTQIPGQKHGSYRAEGPLSLLTKRNFNAYHLFQEFGTVPALAVLKALISKDPQRMLETFFPDDADWKERCTKLGLLRFQQLVKALTVL